MSRKFVPITKEELLTKVNTLYDAILTDEDREDYPDRTTLLDSFLDPRQLSATIERDLSKVAFDFENVAYHHDNVGTGLNGLVGLRVLDNGMPCVGVLCGGDWEQPVFMILYWDGKAVRGYIPKDGNCWNHDTRQAIGNDEEADAKFIKRYIRKNGLSKKAGKKAGKKPTPEELEEFDEQVYSAELVLADIQARIRPADAFTTEMLRQEAPAQPKGDRYEIPQFGIVIQCADGPPGERGGEIVQSDLHAQFADEDDDAPDVDVAFHVTEALERTLLALACAGVDLNTPEFRRGFYEAVEHIADQQFS